MYNFSQCVIKVIKYTVIEMWKNWCFHMLQLKVKGYTPFIKGYLAIFFLLLELIHGFLIFVYWSIFCIFFLIFVYFLY